MLFQSSNPGYYGTTAFLLFSPLSVIYTALSHVCFACLGSLKIQHVPTESIGTETPHVLNKKVAIVTGSNTGIGFETSRALADRGYEVILACRSRDKAMLAVRQIPNAVFLHPLDLSSKESIEEFATVVKAKYSTIHLLVNNAGLNTSGRLEGGLDLCFQTNFLGHFLLTGLLRPVLSSTGRVVNLSSVMHHFSDVEEKDERYWRRCTLYNEKQSTYTPSKLAALLFTIELNKRGIKSYAVNPGAVNSDIWRGFPRWIIPIFSLLYINNAQGAFTSIAACLCDFDSSVIYLQPYWLPFPKRPAFPPMEMLGPFVGYAATAPRLPDMDGTAAAALWKVSEEVTGYYTNN